MKTYLGGKKSDVGIKILNGDGTSGALGMEYRKRGYSCLGTQLLLFKQISENGAGEEFALPRLSF